MSPPARPATSIANPSEWPVPNAWITPLERTHWCQEVDRVVEAASRDVLLQSR